MRWLVIAVLFSTPALAQDQQRPQYSPAEVAVNITSAVNGLAIALENAQRQIKDLTVANEELRKQLTTKGK